MSLFRNSRQGPETTKGARPAGALPSPHYEKTGTAVQLPTLLPRFA
jgi:hypothetical protein